MTENTVDRRLLLAGGIVIALIGAGVAVGVLGWGPSPVLSIDDVEVGVGETATADVAVGPLPGGSAGFELTLSVGDPGVATITNATINEELSLMSTSPVVADNGSSVTAEGADVNQNLQTDSGSVGILTITVEGQSDGSTTLTAEDPTVQDTDGNDMDVRVEQGNVTVGSG